MADATTQTPELTSLYSGAIGFSGGMDSYTLPLALPDNNVVSAENCVNRGGVYQTRPDSRSLLVCPCDTGAQGCILFTPANGIPYLVFASYGKVYISPKPFQSYTQLPNIQFSPQSKYIAWAICQQSTSYDENGNLIYLDAPVPVLVMQDANTRAAYWDGNTSRHLNPTFSGTPNKTVAGLDETRIGLWMCWSNNRLWVSRGNQIFASDIGNPLKFTEAQYLNEGRAFYLSGDCTGITETPDRTGIICFTHDAGMFIRSSLQDRTQWLQPGSGIFSTTFLPYTGCVSHRSISRQYGLLWWYSPDGLTNMNCAQRENLSSKMEISDGQMFDSKYYMGSTLDGICSVPFENILLVSVPSGDKYNRHTWCMDQNPTGASQTSVYSLYYTNVWSSRWTGWRPVEWTFGMVDGRKRVFFQSYDYDGHVRIWEAFTGNTGCDNGVPILAWVRTKEHNFSASGQQPTMDRKKFRWAEFAIDGVIGNSSLMVAYAGRRGAYTPIFTADLVASPGQVYASQVYGSGTASAPLMIGNRPQTRLFRSADTVRPSTCNTGAVESIDNNNLDTQFSLLFVWSGRLGFQWYRMMAIDDPRKEGGDPGVVSETGPLSLNEAGCGAKNSFVVTSPFTWNPSTKTYSATIGGTVYTSTQTAQSPITQKDADNTALSMAVAEVNAEAGVVP